MTRLTDDRPPDPNGTLRRENERLRGKVDALRAERDAEKRRADAWSTMHDDATKEADAALARAEEAEANVRALAEIAWEARICEGLQEWWGVDSERMARFDAVLDPIRRALSGEEA